MNFGQPVYKETKTSKIFNGSLVNISGITGLLWNHFRCISVKSVHKRITVFSKQGQGKNKQMFVVNRYYVSVLQKSICCFWGAHSLFVHSCEIKSD